MMDFDFGEPMETPKTSQYNDRKFDNQHNSYQSHNKGNNKPFDKENWKPKEVEPAKFIEFPIAFDANEDIDPKDYQDKLEQLCFLFKKLNVTVRVNQSNAFTPIFIKEGVMVEQYLPWDTFADLTKAQHTVTNHAVAVLTYKYPQTRTLKPSAKKIVALSINLLLGKYVNSRAGLVIIVTRDGITTPTSSSKISGYSYNSLTYAHDLQIPYYNLTNQTSYEALIKRLHVLNILPKSTGE